MKTTNFRVNKLSQEQLDRFAKGGGILGTLDPDKEVSRGKQPEDRHGYGFRWVGTDPDNPYQGKLIMTPKSDRAQEFLRQGKVELYMEQYDLCRSDADRLYLAAKQVKFGFEDSVLEYAVRTRHNRAWKVWPGASKQVHTWCRNWGMTNHSLSVPRLNAVYEVLQAWT